MEQLVLNVEDLSPEQVAELLRITRQMQAARRPHSGQATPELQAEDDAIHERLWGRNGRAGDVDQEEAFQVFKDVIDHGRHIGRDWAPLLIALVHLGGKPMSRDHARHLVTTDPQQAVHALRGLKQAFARATGTTQHWTFSDTYTAHYDDAYSGVTEISLGEPFCRAVESLLHVDI